MFGGFGQPSSSPFAQSSSSPFGQTSSSPFGQSLFGQSSATTATNPFAPKPFGSPTANPFGSQTAGSIFGGTSTGVFGQSTPAFGASPSPAFGASSSPAFGSSTPAFGAGTTTAFSASSSSFGGSSLFGQKPAFGGFGATTAAQPNPFGSSFQQTQATFGTSPFGSTTSFGSSNQQAFGATTTPSFGTTSTPAFGSTSSPFGATTTPAFGTSTPAFGATSTPAFGATSTPAFGATSTPSFGSTAFGSTGTAFGFSSTPSFVSTPAFGSTGSPIFGSSSTPVFGASTAGAFGASGGQSTTPAFGSTFGNTVFGQSTFGQQQGGSRVVSYTPTVDTDGASGTQPAGKLESISAMPAYKEKCHEELRWEDYQRGDKGGPNPAGQSAPATGFSAPVQTNIFGQTNTFGQTPAGSFPSTSGGLFGQKPAFGAPSFGQSTSAFSSPFGTSTSAFGTSSTSSLFGATSTPAFNASSTPLFGSSVTPSFGIGSSFGSSAAATATPTFQTGLGFGNTQSAGLFQSSPAMGQGSLFGQPTSIFGQTAPSSGVFGMQSTGFGGNIFGTSASLTPSSTPIGFSQTTPSFSTSFQSSPATGGFSFGNFGQNQPAAGGFGSMSNIFGQSTGQPSIAAQANMVVQPAALINPFGTLPSMPQLSTGQAGASSSLIQYGISSMPVSKQLPPMRVSSLLTTPRHISQRRMKLPAKKYHSKTDGPKVPFFYDEEESPSTPKADALFIPRENPRALVIRPIEQWPSGLTNGRNVFDAAPENGKYSRNVTVLPANEPLPNGNGTGENTTQSQDPSTSKSSPIANGFPENEQNRMDLTHTLPSDKHEGKAANVHEHSADIESLMPKLTHPEYFTEPPVKELAAKERAVPGFCRHVKDFVVGRVGYGNIKFLGETDVRHLALESLIQFNHREVIVYGDESKKPPVGQGLNKSAEVTLLNIKCVDKSGHHYTDGPRVENYRKLLMKKAEEQGSKFISYDPVEGEWKFKVDHFSRYGLCSVSELEDEV